MHLRKKSQLTSPAKSTLRSYRKRNFVLSSFVTGARSQSNYDQHGRSTTGGVSVEQLKAKHDLVKANVYTAESLDYGVQDASKD